MGPKVVSLVVPEKVVEGCRRMARRAEIGGRSHVREGDERAEKLAQDQLVGQIAQWAATKHLFGSDFLYRIGRHVADRDPTAGDCGEDVPGLNLDVKGTRIAGDVGDLSAYHLLVRPGERRLGHVYLLVLVELPVEGDEFQGARAYLAGWATDEELSPDPSRDPRFSGAYALPATKLHPVPPFRWFSLP